MSTRITRREQIHFRARLALALGALAGALGAMALAPREHRVLAMVCATLAGIVIAHFARGLVAALFVERARRATGAVRDRLLFDAMCIALPTSTLAVHSLDRLATSLWTRGSIAECIEVIELRPRALDDAFVRTLDGASIANVLSMQVLGCALLGDTLSSERADDKLHAIDPFHRFSGRAQIAKAYVEWSGSFCNEARERIDDAAVSIAWLPDRERLLADILAGRGHAGASSRGSYRGAAVNTDPNLQWVGDVAPSLREFLGPCDAADVREALAFDRALRPLPRPRRGVRRAFAWRAPLAFVVLVGLPRALSAIGLFVDPDLVVVSTVVGGIVLAAQLFSAVVDFATVDRPAIVACERDWSRGVRAPLRERYEALVGSWRNDVAVIARVRMSQLALLSATDDSTQEALTWAEAAVARARVRSSLNDRVTIDAVHAWVVALALNGRARDAERAARWLEGDESEARPALVLAKLYSATRRDLHEARAIAHDTRSVSLDAEHDLLQQALCVLDADDAIRLRERAAAWKAGAAWLRATAPSLSEQLLPAKTESGSSIARARAKETHGRCTIATRSAGDATPPT